MYPVLLDFGHVTLFGYDLHLQLPAYGFFYALALVVGWLVLRAFGRQINPDAPWTDIYFLAAIGGVLGGRLLNGLTVLPHVLRGDVPFYAIFLGGGVWLGGALTGATIYLVLCWRNGVSPGIAANIFFVTVPLAHAVGRVGCFLGGCCYGGECHLPWAVTFTNPLVHEINRTPLNVPLHPTQLYEVFAELIIFAIGFWIWRRGARPWSIAVVWLGLYGIVRFFLEFVRADFRGGAGGLSTSQWLSLGMVVATLVIFFGVMKGRLAPVGSSPSKAQRV